MAKLGWRKKWQPNNRQGKDRLLLVRFLLIVNLRHTQNPRLWGHVRANETGHFRIDTIMPERYPKSSVPRHIHYHVEAKGYPKLVSECFFDADPLLTKKTRRTAPRRNFPIVKLVPGQEMRMTGDLEIRVPRK